MGEKTPEPDQTVPEASREPALSAGAADVTARFDDETVAFSGDTTAAKSGPSETAVESKGPGRRLLGDYELLEEIARGGMGVVWKARQGRLNRLVALKLIRDAAFAGPEDLRRFRTEAQAIADLDHPHIVPIYEVGQENDQPFFSMKLLEGGNLSKHVARLKGDPRAAATLMVKVARAVHYAHQRAILHRDLKPSNILLDEEREPFVVDFGLAKRFQESGATYDTLSGAVMGTAAYMPAEQARGEVKSLTTAADVYSLGATLFECLTGRAPYVADSVAEVLRLVLDPDRDPPRPGALNKVIDRDLEAICLKALQKKAKDRYGSAEELAEDLERWLRREPTKARPVRTWERFWKWTRRRPAIAALVGVLAAALAGFVGVVLWFNVQLGEALRLAEKNAYNANISSARRAIEAGDLPSALLTLEGQKEGLRGFEWPYLFRLGFMHLTKQWRSGIPVASVAVSPDGRLIATGHGRDDGDRVEVAPAPVMLWDLATGERLVEFLVEDGPIFDLAFSPDGRSLATASGDGRARLWDVATGRRLAELGKVRDQANSVAFHPGGGMVVVGGGLRYPEGPPDDLKYGAINERPGEVVAWALADGRELWRRETPSGATQRVAFAPDGSEVATGQFEGVQLRDPESGEVRTSQPNLGGVTLSYGHQGKRLIGSNKVLGGGDLWDLRDGRSSGIVLEDRLRRSQYWDDGFYSDSLLEPSEDVRVASCRGRKWHERDVSGPGLGRGRHLVRYWDLRARVPLYVLTAHQAITPRLAYSPDGRHLVTIDQDGLVCVWRTTVGRPIATVLQVDANPRAVAYSGSAQVLAIGRDDGVVELVGPGERVDLLRGPEEVVEGLAFAPNGHLLATGTDGGTLQVWETATRRLAFPERVEHEGPIHAVAFREDSRLLASAGADGRILVRDPATGERLRDLRGGGIILGLAFDRTGQLVSAGGDGLVHVWDPERGRRVRSWRSHESVVRALAISPDGRLLATAGSDPDRAVRIWDSRGRLMVTIAMEETQEVFTLAFCGLGQTRLATGGQDRVVRLWDVETGRQVLDLPGHEAPISSLAFDAAGTRLVTAGGTDRSVRIWESTRPPFVERYPRESPRTWSAPIRGPGRTQRSP